MKALRLLRGWLCFQAVKLLPVTLASPVYRWLLGWGGWYAQGADGVSESGRDTISSHTPMPAAGALKGDA